MGKRQRASAIDRRNAKRLAGSVGCLGAAALVAAQAASASFNASGSVAQTSNTTLGDVYLTVPGAGSTNRLNVNVAGLYPSNDNRERVVDITNAGNLAVSDLVLRVTASANDALVTDTNGLYVYIEECPSAWTESTGTSPADYTYTCSGNAQQQVKNWAHPASNGTTETAITLTSNINMAAGAVNHLRLSFKLPSNAPSSVQGHSVNLSFTIDADQRTGTDK